MRVVIDRGTDVKDPPEFGSTPMFSSTGMELDYSWEIQGGVLTLYSYKEWLTWRN